MVFTGVRFMSIPDATYGKVKEIIDNGLINPTSQAWP